MRTVDCPKCHSPSTGNLLRVIPRLKAVWRLYRGFCPSHGLFTFREVVPKN
ncbi:MAG TPA: hypothetical protein VMD75_11595 [Candidatus Binataceae bacterium]|nr:hypothetical protein [Candidatus Binataceae bacterium]